MVKQHFSKAIIAGSYVSIRDYDRVLEYEREPRLLSERPVRQKTAEELDALKILNRRKRKTDLTMLVRSNAYQHKWPSGSYMRPHLLTLTFADDVKDLTTANRHFTKFVMRFNTFLKSYGTTLAYNAVPEFTKQGRVHYHVLMYNMPYIDRVYDQLHKLWRHGYTHLDKITDMRGLVNYLCKYLSKQDDDRLFSRKHFFTSRSAFRPQVLFDEAVEVLRNLIQQWGWLWSKSYQVDSEFVSYHATDFDVGGGSFFDVFQKYSSVI